MQISPRVPFRFRNYHKGYEKSKCYKVSGPFEGPWLYLYNLLFRVEDLHSGLRALEFSAL